MPWQGYAAVAHIHSARGVVLTQAISDALKSLREAAANRQAALAGNTRVVVQVGHCSQAIGALDVLDALRHVLPDNDYLVTAGCDGACYAAPRVCITPPDGNARMYSRVSVWDASDLLRAGAKSPSPNDADFFAGQSRLTLDGCGELDALDIDDYILNGGYDGLARALSMTPDEVIEDVLASGLRGRGGAYFPAGLKWRGARAVKNTPPLPCRQLRRGRTWHIQGQAYHGRRPAPPNRGRDYSRLRIRRPRRLHLHQRRGEPIRRAHADRA